MDTKFTKLSDAELREIQGGFIVTLTVIAAAATIIGAGLGLTYYKGYLDGKNSR